MKKIFFACVMAVLIITLTSCVTPPGYNDQQSAFDKLLSIRNNHKFDSRNDIQKAEFLKQFESDLYDYVDSVKLFVNWIGKIESISTRDVGRNRTQVKFNIYYTP